MVIPDIESDVRAKVKGEMKDVSCFSFTSDIWSTGVSNDSLLSLTAHWLRYAMLHAQSLPGLHTGEMICSKYKAMFEEWDIKKE